MKFLKIIFLLMSFICLLQADDSAKTLNLLDKRQQQLHIQIKKNDTLTMQANNILKNTLISL
ncbi:hypothetical protein NUY98_001509 [Campylobacter coli]|nr:hypothetical protein [Campylobacter coli]EAI2220384.1 hypothetical protein [Campylobacter coli]EAI4250347.1 hypothetical protein [Campylobacter coli]EAI5589809.1 hypothetical protein [Campylobacter coli]EAI5607361.1 hypothetical protein [Campylobacter coli]